MAGRYLDGVRPAPAERAASPLGDAWEALLPEYRERLEGCLLHEALAILWDFVGGANKTVDAEQPWVLAKAAKAGDAAAAARLRAVLGDLIEACRLVGAGGRARSCRAPRRGSWPSSATPTRTPPTATAVRPLLDELRWGAHAGETGRLDRPRAALPAARVRGRRTGRAGSSLRGSPAS